MTDAGQTSVVNAKAGAAVLCGRFTWTTKIGWDSCCQDVFKRLGLPAAASLLPYRQHLSCLGQVDGLLKQDQSLPAVAGLLLSLTLQAQVAANLDWLVGGSNNSMLVTV